MSFYENFIMALQSLMAHRMRSILTMLGIIIGVGSVIIVVAIGQGGEAMLKSEIVGTGNTIEVMYAPSDEELWQTRMPILSLLFPNRIFRNVRENSRSKECGRIQQ